MFDACNKLGEKYGPIIGLKIGSDKIVMLNTYEGLKAMTLNEYCDGRPINPVYKVRTFGERRGNDIKILFSINFLHIPILY